MSVQDDLCAAVRTRRVVEFVYADRKLRRVEPYIVWEDSNDNWQLGGWSIGYSESQSEPPWRCYTIADIRGSVTVTSDTFSGLRGGYNPHADRYNHACCKAM